MESGEHGPSLDGDGGVTDAVKCPARHKGPEPPAAVVCLDKRSSRLGGLERRCDHPFGFQMGGDGGQIDVYLWVKDGIDPLKYSGRW